MMKVKILLDKLTEGETMKAIANEIGVSSSTISRKLNKLGYVWDNSTKVWNWEKEGEQPLEHDLFQVPITDISHKGEEQVKKHSPSIHSQFTLGEVAAIKEMLNDWKEGKTKVFETVPLYERIKALIAEEKIRKTIVINKTISERLDTFSEGEKANKSDIIELALNDFFERYNKC